MKRNAWVVAVGLMGLAACSHHDDAKTAQAGTREWSATTVADTTPATTPDARASGDMMNAGVNAAPTAAVRGETANVKKMRQAVASLMGDSALSQADLTAALDAIAVALVDVPDANTGVGVERMRVNIAALQHDGISNDRAALRVHATLVQAIEALRTVNDRAKSDVVELAVNDLHGINESKPVNAQTSGVRTAVCSVGNAVAIAYDARELGCGGATASAK